VNEYLLVVKAIPVFQFSANSPVIPIVSTAKSLWTLANTGFTSVEWEVSKVANEWEYLAIVVHKLQHVHRKVAVTVILTEVIICVCVCVGVPCLDILCGVHSHCRSLWSCPL